MVRCGVGAGGGESGGRTIDGFYGFADGGEVQSEAAGCGEAIERAALGISAGGEIVFALVEEDAGFLASEEIGLAGESVHVDGNRFRDVAREYADFLRKIFFGAAGDIVAGDNAGGMQDGFEGQHDFVRETVHALIEQLDDEPIGITVDDEAGQKIAFGVDETVGVGILDETFAERQGGDDALFDKALVDGFNLTGEQA